jgi:small subunit ribosomal protein S13
MARIAGIDLPAKKSVEIGLTYIYGVGRTRSNAIVKAVGVDKEKKVKDLTEDEVMLIQRKMQEEGDIEGERRKHVRNDISRLIEIGCYRGLRHKKGLPARGQRTHTNARTRKGPRMKLRPKRKTE